jgi:hypothetical protein
MKARKRIILVVGAILAVGLLAACLGAYLQAQRVPHDYFPVALAPAQQEQTRQAMTRRLSQFVSLAGEIGSWDPRPSGHGGQPAAPAVQEEAFVITQDEVNRWLAAAAQPHEGQLAAAGLRRAAVAFGRDRMTFYAFLQQYGTVMGVDLSFHFDQAGWMTLRIDGARAGMLPLPNKLLEARKSELIRYLQEQLKRLGPSDQTPAADPAQLACQSAQALAEALNGMPIRLDIRQHFGNVRIRQIRMEEGKCTLEVVPLTPRPR